MAAALTEEEFKAVLPANMRKSINPLLMMNINNTLAHDEEWENYRENLLGYANVLSQGKFSLEKYLNAVRYVSYKIMSMTNKKAFECTFPDKVRDWNATGVSAKDQSSYHTAYNKSKLVVLIFTQSLIPTHILNADIFQQAINTQAAIMTDTTVSAMVRMQAANSLLTHLKAPETKKIELDIGIATSSVHEDYRVIMNQMAEKQLEWMEKGGDVKEITNVPIKLVRGEVIDI